jgi:hypothetical protein
MPRSHALSERGRLSRVVTQSSPELVRTRQYCFSPCAAHRKKLDEHVYDDTSQEKQERGAFKTSDIPERTVSKEPHWDTTESANQVEKAHTAERAQTDRPTSTYILDGNVNSGSS